MQIIGITEKKAIFLYIMVYHSSNRQVQNQYQYFISIISHYFNGVLQVFFQLYVQYVRLSKSPYFCSVYSLKNFKYIFYFNNYIKVMDRTYMSIYILANEGIFYQN